jgi:dipeptidyl aminopeptidase/acylaminoacyl peptidase
MRIRLALLAAILLLASVAAHAQELFPADRPDGLKPLTLYRSFTKPALRGNTPSNYAWSRDDKLIAYAYNGDGWTYRELWVLDPASGERWRVTNLFPRDLAEAVEANAEIEDAEKRKTEDEVREDVQRQWGAGGPLWGPDGMLYFSWQGDIWRIPAGRPADGEDGQMQFAEPELFLNLEGWIGGFQFSEDGGRLAFNYDNAFWIRDLATGAMYEAGQGAGNLSQSWWNWSPDGRYLAFVRTDSSGIRQVDVVDYIAENVNAWGVSRPRPGDMIERSRIGIVDTQREGRKRNEARMLKLGETEEIYVSDISWSPTGKSLFIGTLSKDTKTFTSYLAEPATGRTALITSEADDKWFNSIGSAQWQGDNAIVFPSERDGWNHLYRLDISSWSFPPEKEKDASTPDDKPDGGDEKKEAPPDGHEKPFAPTLPAPMQLTYGQWEVQWTYIPRSADCIYSVTTERGPDTRNLYRLTPDGAVAHRLTFGRGTNTLASWGAARGETLSWDESRAIIAANEPVTGPVEYLLDLRTGERGLTIHGGHPAEFYTYRWVEPEFTHFPAGYDDSLVAAKVFRPPYAKPGERRPLVVYVHGAGYAQDVARRSEWLEPIAMYMADTLGYIVVVVDYRGSSGYGRKWRTDVWHQLGVIETAECKSIAQTLIDRSEVAAERVGVWGWSYGGFLTNYIMFTAPETFKAGVAVAAVNDWKNYHTWYCSQRLGDPKENAEAYKLSSPIEHCEGLQGQLLMIHGIRDDNVFFQDFAQLMKKLTEAGKHFDTMPYPEMSHGPNSDDIMVHLAESVCGYFQRCFGLGPGAPGPQPEDSLEYHQAQKEKAKKNAAALAENNASF